VARLGSDPPRRRALGQRRSPNPPGDYGQRSGLDRAWYQHLQDVSDNDIIGGFASEGFATQEEAPPPLNSAASQIADMKFANRELPLSAHIQRENDDLSTYCCSIVEINDVVIDQANATCGNIFTNGPRLVRAVDPVECVSISLP
jgi:hypothetical protein